MLLDLFFPPRCEGCERPLPCGRERGQGPLKWLCQPCLGTLPRLVAPFCNTCGESYPGNITGAFRCGNCAPQTFHFDFAIAAYHADGLVRDLVHRFKYQRQLHLRGLLGHLLQQVLEDERLRNLPPETWRLVPVPLHPLRRWHREFNQSWELCRELSRLSAIPVVDALRRHRFTRAQARLSRNQRLQNLRNAFSVKPRHVNGGILSNAHVLLVDDVLTTGSTANECARVLRREAAVEKVVVISVARG